MAFKKSTVDDDMIDVQTRLAISTKDHLTELSRTMGVSRSRLIAYAVDNEMDSPQPFNFAIQLPTTPYVEGQYMSEAGKVLRYIARSNNGCVREAVILCRRDIGVPDKEILMLAVRELLELGHIEEYKSKVTMMNFGPDTIRYRALDSEGKPKSAARYWGERIHYKKLVRSEDDE